MKKFLLALAITSAFMADAQDTTTLMKEGENLEHQFKDDQALDKYKAVVLLAPGNLTALVKATEFSCVVGGHETDKVKRNKYFTEASDYASRAIAKYPNTADANYAMSLAEGRMSEVETENKKIVARIHSMKDYAEKAVRLDPENPKGQYILGKWHLEMVTASWFKRMALKAFFRDMPPASLDQAIAHLEKCRNLSPYFVIVYLDLAKVYKEQNRPGMELEALNQLQHLPPRISDDLKYKAEGRAMLKSLQ